MFLSIETNIESIKPEIERINIKYFFNYVIDMRKDLAIETNNLILKRKFHTFEEIEQIEENKIEIEILESQINVLEKIIDYKQLTQEEELLFQEIKVFIPK